jgi:hypothetical protein
MSEATLIWAGIVGSLFVINAVVGSLVGHPAAPRPKKAPAAAVHLPKAA